MRKGHIYGRQCQQDVHNQQQSTVLEHEAKDAGWPPKKHMSNWKLYKGAKDENETAFDINSLLIVF